MKKKLLYLFIAISSISFGQTLENTYTSSGYIEQLPNYSFISNNMMNYYTLDWTNNQVKLYDSSHNLYKTVTLNLGSGNEMRQLYLASDKLFNSDSKIEFIIKAGNDFILFNEDGNKLFTFSSGVQLKLTKTPESTFKLLISGNSTNSNEIIYKVYGLSGTLSTSQENLLNKAIIQYPNPTSENLNLKNLKSNGKENILEIFSIEGKKVLSKKIAKNKNEISVNISHLSKGIYIYKIGELSNKFVKE